MSEFLKKLLTPEHITSLVLIAAALMILWAVKRYYSNHKFRMDDNRSSGKRKASHLVYDVIRALIALLAILAVLQVNGINVTSLVTGLGIASVIVGLAVQNPLSDIIMGLHIMREHYFSEGDVVELDGMVGVVISFSMQSTKIRDLEDGTVLSICNREIIRVKLLGKMFDINLPLPYDEELRHVDETMKTVCQRLQSTDCVEQCLYLGADSFEDSAILYKLRLVCNPAARFDVKRKALRIIQEQLEIAHISIPFNQLDVHLDSLIK